MTPKISCLCVTENRAAFMPWLLWAFDRQTWRSKELVIVDSSSSVFQPQRADVRVIAASPGASVPAKRNVALAAATGELVAWFDDDDWQHPERLSLLARAFPEQCAFVGATHSWFIDLHTGRARPYDGHGNVIFNSALFRRDAVAPIRFEEQRLKASDTIWMRAVTAQCGRGAAIRARHLTMWLCHDTNISNPRSSRAFSDHVDSIKRQIGETAWGDSDRELERLRARLPASTQATPWVHPLPKTTFPELADGAERRVHRLRQVARRGVEVFAAASEPEPIAEQVVAGPPGLVLPSESAHVTSWRIPTPASHARERRVTVRDVEIALLLRLGSTERRPLDLLVAHLIRQARCTFVQKVAFGGESPRAEADASTAEPPAGKTAVTPFDGVVDPAEGAGRRALQAALSCVTAPYVLVACTPVLFHATAGSWVTLAVDRLERDSRLLFVTSQCGAAAGPAGSPRNRPKSAGRARWDGQLQVWRRQRAAGPAFVASRARLAGALSLVPHEIDDDLERSLTAALRSEGAECASLSGRDGWALPIEGSLLPDAAADAVALAEAGLFPEVLGGRSSVRLDESLLLAARERLATEGARQLADPQRYR